MINTFETINPTIDDLTGNTFNYQKELTGKLDNLYSDFNQEIINEIVLWKINRYSEISTETLNLINQIKQSDSILNNNLTKRVLKGLLKSKGIRLAMASTILRFKNPKIYQIIDQRVYRFIYGTELKYSLTDIENQIELYLSYIDKLTQICDKYKIDFAKSDRVIYEMDKKYNSELKIKY